MSYYNFTNVLIRENQTESTTKVYTLNSCFSNCVATSSPANGGAIYTTSRNDINLISTVFTHCIA